MTDIDVLCPQHGLKPRPGECRCDDDTGCEGHEDYTCAGENMGRSIYCDGTCRAR